MKDYGEPWSYTGNHNRPFVDRCDQAMLFNNKKFPIGERENRIVDCVNALSGVPDAWLKDAKKAIVAMQVFPDQFDRLFKKAVAKNERYQLGPELNALIDSFKE